MRHSDPIDQANEVADRLVQDAIDNRPREPRRPPIGRCYNCEDPLAGDNLFCDADCRDDYEWMRKRKQANRV